MTLPSGSNLVVLPPAHIARTELSQHWRWKTQLPNSPATLTLPTLFSIHSRSAVLPQCAASSVGATMAVEMKKVDVVNVYGEKLAGVLHDTGSEEVVVLCHGFRSSKEYGTLLNIATALTGVRISVFRFDFAGNGESEGVFQYGNYRREADDLRAVILHLIAQNRKIAAIAGHSKGGNIVLLYASVYHDVPTVVNMSGRFALEEGIESRLGAGFMERIMKDGFIDVKGKSGDNEFRVTKESLMDRLSTDMLNRQKLQIRVESIDNFNTNHEVIFARVLTVHGSADEILPVKDATEIAKLIPNHKLHIVEGADHGYSHQDELISVVLDFIKTGIQHVNWYQSVGKLTHAKLSFAGPGFPFVGKVVPSLKDLCL